MTQTDKRISAYTDQIIHYIDKLVEFIEPSQYEYNQEVVEDAVREIDDRLKFLKQKLIIEHGGMQLTTPPQKLPNGILLQFCLYLARLMKYYLNSLQ